ncbi:hypothetical protein ABK040_002705 [Willaertia magna]
MYTKRLQKEIHKLLTEQSNNEQLIKQQQNNNTNLPTSGMGIDIFLDPPNDNSLKIMYCTIIGAKHTLYENEKFRLKFTFPDDYPLQSPEVVFVPPFIPLHEHVYTNGHICLNILYDGWSPVMNVQSVCMSIQSMLSSATEKKKPRDNDTYVMTNMNISPKQTRWWFHDDKV